MLRSEWNSLFGSVSVYGASESRSKKSGISMSRNASSWREGVTGRAEREEGTTLGESLSSSALTTYELLEAW